MSSSNSSSPSLPPHAIIEQSIGLSFAIDTVANLPDLPIIKLIPYLLSNPAYANSTIPPGLIPPTQIASTLQNLNDTLPLLPTDDIRPKINILYAFVVIFSIAVVSLRLYVRKFITPRTLYAEDWTCLFALFMTVVFNGVMWPQNTYGHTGQHIYLLSLNDIKAWSYWGTVTGIVFTVNHFAVKITFLVFYYRLYPNRRYHWAVWGVGIFVSLVTVSSILVFVLECFPLDWWNHLATAKCINRKLAWTLQGIWYILADFLILTLPLPIVFKLQLPLLDKLLLVGLFSLGSFISVISIIRLIALREWLSTADFSYAFGKHVMWASVEILLSLVVSCAPAIKVLFFRGDGEKEHNGVSKISFGKDGLFKRTRSTGQGTLKSKTSSKKKHWLGSLFTDADTTMAKTRDEVEDVSSGSDIETGRKSSITGGNEKIAQLVGAEESVSPTDPEEAVKEGDGGMVTALSPIAPRKPGAEYS